jgi:small-conductance mechanosensitive channel
MTIFEKIDLLPSAKKNLLGIGLLAPFIIEVLYLVFAKQMMTHMFLLVVFFVFAYVGLNILRGKTTKEIEDKVSKKIK